MTRVAVTGAAGHIGANLVRLLLASGHEVRVLVHQDTRGIEGLDVERVPGDVRNVESLRELLAGAEVLYHLAGKRSLDGDQGGLVQEINVEGTRNVVTAALDNKGCRMVHVSAIHAFDLTPGKPITESGRRASSARHSAYGRSKAVAEEQVRQGVERGLDAVILNPTLVIGPYDFGPSYMGRMLLLLQQRRLPALIEGGFHWLDARDLCQTMLVAAERGKRGENYILTGQYASLRELAQLSSAITEVPPPRVTTPQWVARLGAPFATLGARIFHRDPLFTTESLATLCAERRIPDTKARDALGHDPRPLRQTIEDTYLWFREAGFCPTLSTVNREPHH